MEAWKKQLLIRILEILGEQGLLTEEEKDRMKIMIYSK